MRFIFAAAAACSLAMPMSSAAKSQDRDVTVQGMSLSPPQWVVVVSRKLDDTLRAPYSPFGQEPYSGIVSVRFRADEANRPALLIVSRRSGIRALDQAALRAVSRIGTMPAMPAAFRRNQSFVANIVFAKNEEDHARQIAILRRESKLRTAARLPAGEDVALAAAPRTGAGS